MFVSNAVTFTANLASQAVTPTGTVTFYDGSTAIGITAASGGMATLTTSALPLGSHAIRAVYSGDSNYRAVTSSDLAENIEDFALRVSGGVAADSQTVYPGSAADYSLTLAPLGGAALAGAVSMSISGLPAGTTATFTPAAVTANSATTNLMLQVTPMSIAALQRGEQRRVGTSVLGLLLGLVVLPFAGRLRRAGRYWLPAAVIAWIAVMAFGISACGGITYTAHSYTLTVKAQSGNLSHTTTVKLTIE